MTTDGRNNFVNTHFLEPPCDECVKRVTSFTSVANVTVRKFAIYVHTVVFPTVVWLFCVYS